MSPNQAEWLIADLACSCQGFVAVPLYDTLGPDAVDFIIGHAEVRAVVCSFNNLAQMWKLKQSKKGSLEYVILMDDNLRPQEQRLVATVTGTALPAAASTPQGKQQKGAAKAVQPNATHAGHNHAHHPTHAESSKEPIGLTHLFSRVEALGKSRPFPDNVPRPSDIFTICYTSGTTGNPKGAVVLHSNMIACLAGIEDRMPPEVEGEYETLFSYLPLAHIYERIMEHSTVTRGHAIGYFQGDTLKLVDDVAELKPSIFPGVPRVWQRVYDRIKGQIEEGSFVKRWLFQKAYAAKQESLARGDPFPGQPSFWDKLVLSKVAARFGGNVKTTISGAAPMSSSISEFLKIALLAHYAEGYGLTETCGALSTISMYDHQYGQVGSPVSCSEVKLVDVPDMCYLTTDKPCPRGEIWIRGPNVFAGYYKDPAKTAECMEDDGWFRTGDVGIWRPDGNLQIIDRAKNIFKLAQGEYIRPEFIEGIYKQNKYVANIFVHGDSKQDYLVAVVVPNFENLIPWAEASGLKDIAKNQEALCKDPRVIKFLDESLKATAVSGQLRGFEVVKKLILTNSDFTVDNGLLTPTFKLKRFAVQQAYQKAIDGVYSSISSKL